MIFQFLSHLPDLTRILHILHTLLLEALSLSNYNSVFKIVVIFQSFQVGHTICQNAGLFIHYRFELSLSYLTQKAVHLKESSICKPRKSNKTFIQGDNVESEPIILKNTILCSKYV
jgi:hypothetical protein